MKNPLIWKHSHIHIDSNLHIYFVFVYVCVFVRHFDPYLFNMCKLKIKLKKKKKRKKNTEKKMKSKRSSIDVVVQSKKFCCTPDAKISRISTDFLFCSQTEFSDCIGHELTVNKSHSTPVFCFFVVQNTHPQHIHTYTGHRLLTYHIIDCMNNSVNMRHGRVI